jgi:translation initiation factor 1A
MSKRKTIPEKTELLIKEEGQEYAKVLKMLGNGRLSAYCFDGIERMCHIRGKLKKKVWIGVNDIILISLRDFQDGKADILSKYSDQDIRQLVKMGELPNTTTIENKNEESVEDYNGFDFDDI